MISKINEVLGLSKELERDYGVIYVKDWGTQIGDLDKFLSISEGNETIVYEGDGVEFPYRLSLIKEGHEIFILLGEESFREYKKATATTVTKESDTL